MATTSTFGDVLITGGTGALGSAVAKAFLDAGASCHVTWRSERELERFDLRDQVKLYQADVSAEADVVKLFDALPAIRASIHLVGGFAMSPVDKTTADEFQRMFQMNALSTFLCCREAIKKFREAKSGGRIVNVAARPAVQPVGGMVAYSVSKSAVASLTQSLAEEVKPEGILVNAVLPSLMDTPANRKAMPNAAYSKWPKVEEVAQAILFLASPQNALTTGALVPVFGQV
jgi:NAD(P)-dependent dehydrogenase (short-subunit alcohol dehydrogenase family)